MVFVHGANGYRVRGCRCDTCKKGNAEYHTKIRREKADSRFEVNGRLVSYHPNAIHGKSSTYGYYMCRCEPCTLAANAERLKRSHARKK